MDKVKVWQVDSRILCEIHKDRALMWGHQIAKEFQDLGICMECLADAQLMKYQDELENDDGLDGLELLAAMEQKRRKRALINTVKDVAIVVGAVIICVALTFWLMGCFKEDQEEGIPPLTMLYCQTDVNRQPDMMHCYDESGKTYIYPDIQAMEGDVCLICCDAGWNDGPEGTCPAEFCTVCLISAFWWMEEDAPEGSGPYSVRGGCDKDQRWMVDSYSEASYWQTCKQQQAGGYR